MALGVRAGSDPMTALIEDHALIGDRHTAALVDRDGTIDWLCLPRFDSGAVFAALIGDESHGGWSIAPAQAPRCVGRSYDGESLVLRTELAGRGGRIALHDFMALEAGGPVVVRIVEGLEGDVEVVTTLRLRFDYGSVVPWVERIEGGITAVAGPDRVSLWTSAPLRGLDLTTVGEFAVRAGERVPFVLRWQPSHEEPRDGLDAERARETAHAWWTAWAARCDHQGPHRDAVIRSLITLEALTYAPTGGIVAAPTTSLPERLGGVRNWDYRFCWLRDATLTLLAFLSAGYGEEAEAWERWLRRAVAGEPSSAQILYAIDGARRVSETSLDWLPGYAHSRPVRIGNAASEQLQLDVFGEVLDAMFQARKNGLKKAPAGWALERALVRHLCERWSSPDHGIWEVRGPRRHFTHSKVMAWVAFDRAIRSAERFGLEAPLEHWRGVRDTIRRQVLAQGYDPELGSFVQFYGSRDVDASLLMIPLVGFLEPDDPRALGTMEAIRASLTDHGLVARYRTHGSTDGLPPGEGLFLPCSFWLVDNLALTGRRDEAHELLERVLALRNDVGLLSEEYDPVGRRFLGNFPQAFSHVALVNSCMGLAGGRSPAERKRG